MRIHDEGNDGLWAEVVELPGCFASGFDLDELREALVESLSLYMSTPEHEVHVHLAETRQVEREGHRAEGSRLLAP